MRVRDVIAVALALVVSSACSSALFGPSAIPSNPDRSTLGGATGLPGGGATGLPGAQLSCDPNVPSGSASCTIAINVHYPALSDPTTPASLIPGYQPPDLQAAYALPSMNAGGLVAIVDAYDDATVESDLSVYRTAMGLPACTSQNGCFAKLNQSGQSGGYPAPDLGWDQEIALDVEMVSAACPLCRITVVEANSNAMTDLAAAVDTAASLHPVAISNSYYSGEWSGETLLDSHYHHTGIAITVSSGDAAAPAYPAASRYVTSVGGTTLSKSGTAFSEAGWPYDGHGCSKYESKPSWQSGAATGCSTRSTVDVAAVGDPQSGVAMYSSQAGGWVVAGGTSVGAPVVAAGYALAANPQGPGYSYAHASAFHDVPPAGYDKLTGLGSPNGVAGL